MRSNRHRLLSNCSAGLRIGVLLVVTFQCTARVRAQEVLLLLDGTTHDALRHFAAIPDFDGDGARDLLLGLPVRDSIRVVSSASGDLLMEIFGVDDTGFGYWVDSAGNFDGDGVPDFLVGAINDHTAGTYRGAAHVLSGADGSFLASMYGEFFEERFGFHVAGLGDIDNDGYDDVGVTAKYHRRVGIYGGPDGHLIRQHAVGATGTGWRRPAIASTGDVDMDGIPDYVIGWPTDATGGSLSGTVILFSGRGGTPIHEVHGPTATGDGLQGSHLGFSVAGVGDVDGDGIPDFAAGAPGGIEYAVGPPPTQGSVRIYSGLNALLIRAWDGAEQTGDALGAYFGYHIAGGGDLNGDGTPDILAGAPLGGGTSRGEISALSGRTGERLWRIVGTDSNARMYFAAVAGDQDSDAFTDFSAADPGADFTGNNAGRITVYAGAPGDLERHCTGDPLASPRRMRLETSGALGIGNNFLTLWTDDAPPNGLGIFVYGPLGQELPMAGGWLCTGPPSYVLGSPVPADANGLVELALDFTQPPLSAGPSQVLPGSTWSFQLWTRDTTPPATGPRLSDGLAITFPP